MAASGTPSAFVWPATYLPCPDQAGEMVLVALPASDAPGFLAQVKRLVPKGAVVLTPHDGLKATLPSTEPRLQPDLTARQRDIVALLVEGLSNKQIARRLGLSHFTVRNHVSQVLRAFDLTTRQQAIARFKCDAAPQDHSFCPLA